MRSSPFPWSHREARDIAGLSSPMVTRRRTRAQEKGRTDRRDPLGGAARAAERRVGAARPRRAGRRQPLRLRLGQEDVGRGDQARGRVARRPRRRCRPQPLDRSRRPPAALPRGDRAGARSGRPASIDGKVGKSDTLGRLLKKSGLSGGRDRRGDPRAVGRARLQDDPRRPDVPHRARRRRPREAVRARAQQGARRCAPSAPPTGELVGKADNSQTRIEVKSIGGRIDSSLYAAIKARRRDAGARRLLRRRVRLRPRLLQRHPRRRHVPRRRREGAHDATHGVRALPAHPRRRVPGKAGTFRTFCFGTAATTTTTAQSSEKTLLKTPLKFAAHLVAASTARACTRSCTPCARTSAIDYAAPTGTPVWAAAGGVDHAPRPRRRRRQPRHDPPRRRHRDRVHAPVSKFADGLKVGQRDRGQDRDRLRRHDRPVDRARTCTSASSKNGALHRSDASSCR